jgi:plastocyanin
MQVTASRTAGPDSGTRGGTDAGTIARLLAAAAILAGGLVHLQLYFDGYRDFPDQNLGRSFVMNGIASVIVAAALVVRTDWWVRLAGIGVVAGTLAAFALSRTDNGIFGFTETGLNPSPQGFLTVATEVAALVLLATTFVPQLGAGRAVKIPVAVPIVGATVVFAVVMSVLWNQSPDELTEGTGNSESTDGGSTDDTDTSQSESDTDTTVGEDAPGAAALEVAIDKFAFAPEELTVAVGDTVVWTNAEGVGHSVVSDDDTFASERLEQGDAFEFTFDTAGAFAYICGIHPSMAATVVVE